jgi:hypothetical protein
MLRYLRHGQRHGFQLQFQLNLLVPLVILSQERSDKSKDLQFGSCE